MFSTITNILLPIILWMIVLYYSKQLMNYYENKMASFDSAALLAKASIHRHFHELLDNAIEVNKLLHVIGCNSENKLDDLIEHLKLDYKPSHNETVKATFIPKEEKNEDREIKQS